MSDKAGRNVCQFKDNTPGKDWAYSFLKRHQGALSNRFTQNIKMSRAEVSEDIIREYFNNLSDSIKDVPSCNIWNYDETNFMDDPGKKGTA